MSTLIDSIVRYTAIPVAVVVALAVLVGVLTRFRKRTPENRKRGRFIVWGSSLTASALVAAVVVVMQVPFYRGLFGSKSPLPEQLPWMVPVAVEVFAWVFTIQSVYAVLNDKPSGRYERLMWACSGAAAAVNAIHNITLGQAVTGLILGALSMGAPLLVHVALRWDRDAQSDKSTAQFRETARRARRQAAQVVCHPIHTARAVYYTTNLGCPWDIAYRIALTGQYDAVHAVLVEQMKQALPTVDKPAIAAPSTTNNKAIEQDFGVFGESLFPACTDPLIEDLHTLHNPGDMFAVWSLHDAKQEDRASQETSDNGLALQDQDGLHNKPVQASGSKPAELAEQADKNLHNKSLQGPECKGSELAQQGEQGLQNKPADGLQNDRAQGFVQDDKPLAASRQQASSKGSSKPRRKAASKRVVQAKAERQEYIAARYWHECKTQGKDPRSKPGVEIARQLGIGPSAVSRGFRWAEDGFNPDAQNGEA